MTDETKREAPRVVRIDEARDADEIPESLVEAAARAEATKRRVDRARAEHNRDVIRRYRLTPRKREGK